MLSTSLFFCNFIREQKQKKKMQVEGIVTQQPTMGSLKRKSPEEPSTSSSQPLHDCVHHVSYPPGYTHPSSPSTQTHAEPAKKFPFTLDPFQSQAITCLENGESVMVTIQTKFYFLFCFCFLKIDFLTCWSCFCEMLRCLLIPLLAKPWWRCMLLRSPSEMGSA